MNKKPSLDDCVYLCMRDGRYWTYWELQAEIKERTGKFYNENSISCAVRNLRKAQQREKYNLPSDAQVQNCVPKKRRASGKGWKFKLIQVVAGQQALWHDIV